MSLLGIYLACLWVVLNKPHDLARLIAMANLFWFFELHPVTSRGRICPVDVKKRDKISGMVYISRGSIPARTKGSLAPFWYEVAGFFRVFFDATSMFNLTCEKSNGSYVWPALNLVVNILSMLIGGLLFSCKLRAIPTTFRVMRLSVSLLVVGVHASSDFISGVEGSTGFSLSRAAKTLKFLDDALVMVRIIVGVRQSGLFVRAGWCRDPVVVPKDGSQRLVNAVVPWRKNFTRDIVRHPAPASSLAHPTPTSTP